MPNGRDQGTDPAENIPQCEYHQSSGYRLGTDDITNLGDAALS